MCKECDKTNGGGSGCFGVIMFMFFIIFGSLIMRHEEKLDSYVYFIVYLQHRIVMEASCAVLSGSCRDIKVLREELNQNVMKGAPGTIPLFQKIGILYKGGAIKTATKPEPRNQSGFVDLRKALVKYPNIKFKDKNRVYNINPDIIKYPGFIRAISELNTRFRNITITETTEGTHAKGQYSHEEGYKIDIRTKDRSFEDILEIMRIFDKNNMYVVFEHTTTTDSIELAHILRDKYDFQIRLTDNGEHIDINLARCSSGLVRSE